MRRARFWDMVNGGWVRLALEYGAPALAHDSGGPTDEGYAHEWIMWSYGDGGQVVRQSGGSSRDCDGRYTWGTERSCDVDKLPACGLTPVSPEWIEAGEWQRDHSAEAAGY